MWNYEFVIVIKTEASFLTEAFISLKNLLKMCLESIYVAQAIIVSTWHKF